MPPALRRLRDRSPSEGQREGKRGLTALMPGPPFLLPGAVDRVAEGWWRLSPRARSLIVAAGIAAVLVAGVLRVTLSPYGPPVDVLVAATDLAAGDVPGVEDVAAMRWPRDLLPSGAPAAEADLPDARLTMDVTAGTVLTRRHLRDDGLLAGLAPGMAAVPVPAELLVGATTGTVLDLVALVGDGSGRTVATAVRVLATDGGTVWLEVGRDRAADVAAAALRGTLSGAVLAP